MLDNEKIISCDWNKNEGILEYDISHLHPDLDVLLQEYTTDSYEGKRIYQSSFSLFRKGAEEPGDFSYLSKEVKEQIWDTVFAVKHKFFADCKPDIVEHFIEGAYSIEKRYERYHAGLMPLGYSIELNKTRRTITYYKQEGGPTSNGGPPLFFRQATASLHRLPSQHKLRP